MTPDKRKVASASKVRPSPINKEQPNSARAHSSSRFVLTSEHQEEIEKSQRSSQAAGHNRWQPKETEPSQHDDSVYNAEEKKKVTPRDVEPDSRVQFETFDSSMEDLKDEKLVFKYIQRMDFPELVKHLQNSRDKYDLLSLFDKSGYTPMHYAAYKNIDKAVEILIKFVLNEYEE